ncbi:TLC domain-containing protein [Apiospora kogelbergensis]|uniref:TLC domain-containing protein n=1 Tax=Apiospora kogelbergensis TaxID=1337665 RepID=A0AAW0QPA6_9PEZI
MSVTSTELQAPAPLTVPRKEPKVEKTQLTLFSQWLFDNQASLSFKILVPFLLAHVYVPAAQPYTSRFFSLSYYNPRTDKYGAGPGDLCLVATCIVLCIGIRAAIMQHVLEPLARYLGVTKDKDATRFAEQSWMLVYYSAVWPSGVYLYYQSPYFLNLGGLWAGWPHKEIDGLMKVYITVQWAYWMQQLIVVNIEARRKDYFEMMFHHVVTITLIIASYAYHLTRVGHLILVLMDVVDLILPLAKCFKYLGCTTVCNALFGFFLCTWALTRHVLYLMVCWSFFYDLPRVVTVPCYKGTADELRGPFLAPEDRSYLLEPFYDPAGTVCLTNGILTSFFTFLMGLELVICAWSFLILRVIARMLKGRAVEDVRSDDETEVGEREKQCGKAVGLKRAGRVGAVSTGATPRGRRNT